MRTAIKIIFLSALIVLSSCSVFKNYKRAEIQGLDSLFTKAGADSVSITDLGWKEFFTDTLLQKLIEEGLQNNADLKIAHQRTIQAEASLKAARLAFLPSLGFSPTIAYENASRYSGGNAYSFNVPSLGFSWEIDINGKLHNGKKMAIEAAEQARVYELGVKSKLIAAIASQYYSLEMLDAKLRVSERTAKNWKENVRIMRSLKRAGMANEASVAQTEANSYSIEASLFDLRYDISRMEGNLAALIGVTPRKFKRGSLKTAHITDDLNTGIPMELLSRRPDVMVAERELRKAWYNTNVARSAFYPSLTISGDFGWEKALTSAPGWAFGFAAGMLAPVFNKGKNKANLEIAKAQQEAAGIAFKQSLLDAGKEVNDALAKCKAAEAKTDVRNNQIASLEKAVESTQSLMRHSQSTTYLEVLTANQSLLAARLLQISDEYDSIQGIISLYLALGGGAE